ncbi:MAG: FliG C-terminal domain-containing protein [Thermoguttaceae bacterium]
MNNGIQKTALFLKGLPETAAQTLLARLEPAAAEQIRVEMMRLSNIPQERVKKTVSDFLNAIDSNTPPKTQQGSKPTKQTEETRVEFHRPTQSEIAAKAKTALNSKPAQQNDQTVVFQRPGSNRKQQIADEQSVTYENPALQDKTNTQEKPVINRQQLDTYESVAANSPIPTVQNVVSENVTSGSDTNDVNSVASEKNDNPFGFLLNLTSEQLYILLQGESEPVIAVVLCYIPSKLAGDLLSRYSSAVQKEIVARLVQLEETDQDVLNEVVETLKNRTEELFGKTRNRIGLNVAKEILRNINPQISRTIISDIEHLMPELRIYKDFSGDSNSDTNFRESTHESINVDFERLEDLSDDDLYELYNSVDPQTAVLSLVGAKEDFINRIIQFYTPEQEARLHQRVRSLGPIGSGDIEKAREVVLRARKYRTSTTYS